MTNAPTSFTITPTEFLALTGNLEALSGIEVDPNHAAEVILAGLCEDVVTLAENDEPSSAPDVLSAIRRRALQAKAALQIWERSRQNRESPGRCACTSG